MSRKLASLRKVHTIEPIEGADKIELAHIDGWQCVVKKGEFQVGDHGIYFEIDSRLPEKEWSEFLRPRKFKVKTMKMRGVLSQGLFLPVSTCFPDGGTWPSDGDLTTYLGVTKILTEEERKDAVSRDKTPWYYFLLPKFLRTKRKWGFPEFLRKTDEERIQNIKEFDKLLEGRTMYATEKLDGQSVTVFYHRKLWKGFRKGSFGVCSRNVYFGSYQYNNWWNAAKKYQLDYKLREYCNRHSVSLAIQGEIVGPGIQGNIYGLPFQDLYVFSVWDIENQRYLCYKDKCEICDCLGLEQVPLVDLDVSALKTKEDFLSYAERKSTVGTRPLAEGVVVRDIKDDAVSFKAISNKFLLRHDSAKG